MTADYVSLRHWALNVCSGNVDRARQVHDFVNRAGDVSAEAQRKSIVELNPYPINGPQEWLDALSFLEGRDAE